MIPHHDLKSGGYIETTNFVPTTLKTVAPPMQMATHCTTLCVNAACNSHIGYIMPMALIRYNTGYHKVIFSKCKMLKHW